MNLRHVTVDFPITRSLARLACNQISREFSSFTVGHDVSSEAGPAIITFQMAASKFPKHQSTQRAASVFVEQMPALQQISTPDRLSRRRNCVHTGVPSPLPNLASSSNHHRLEVLSQVVEQRPASPQG